MIQDLSKLVRGQMVKVDIDQVRDRLPPKLLKRLIDDPLGKLIGFKMVDGNQFGLVLELGDGCISWFFANELSEIE